MQNVAETHDTPVRAASVGPLSPGVVCVVHVAARAADAIAAADTVTAQTTVARRCALRTMLLVARIRRDQSARGRAP